MTVKITHPEKNFTGNAINLDFTGGVAEAGSLSKEARAVLAEHDFKVENAKSEPTDAEKAAAEKAKADKAEADRIAAEKAAAAAK